MIPARRLALISLSSNRRSSMTVDEFKRVISRGHLHRFLYHFTDMSNLPSIARHGILSKQEARKRNVVVSVPGGNEWSQDADAYRGLEGYVNLCFTKDHPMCYKAQSEGRLPNPQYLPIDPDVLRFEGVKIALDVANKANTELFRVEEGLERLDKEVLYTRTAWKNPQILQRLRNAKKCEILVPTRVPINLIRTKL